MHFESLEGLLSVFLLSVVFAVGFIAEDGFSLGRRVL